MRNRSPPPGPDSENTGGSNQNRRRARGPPPRPREQSGWAGRKRRRLIVGRSSTWLAFVAVNETLLSLEQAFQYADGLQFGDQYRSLYASPNSFNGYAAWMLPGLRHPVETDASADTLARWTDVYRDAIVRLAERVRTAMTQLQRP
ncbi:MAG: hypothetical protein BRD31_04000 [Bacteroidetes bacterium QH_2_64_26]|nr:MAG: hypothetical protein BRD31_04000 [Bacteroidetes bacterium QH_2_64_26]